jgi:hypothetical protein
LLPPFEAGVVMVRVRPCLPGPHVLLHVLQVLYVATQSTGAGLVGAAVVGAAVVGAAVGAGPHEQPLPLALKKSQQPWFVRDLKGLAHI